MRYMWKVCNTSTIHILRSLLWPIIKPGVKWNIPYTRPLNLHTYCYLLPSLRFYRSLSLSLFLYILSLFSFAIISSSLFSLFHMQLDGMHLFRNCLITLSFIQMKDSIGYSKWFSGWFLQAIYILLLFPHLFYLVFNMTIKWSCMWVKIIFPICVFEEGSGTIFSTPLVKDKWICALIEKLMKKCFDYFRSHSWYFKQRV